MIEREPEALAAASEHLVRHRSAFIDQLSTRADVLRAQFDAIDALEYRPSFDAAVQRAVRFLGSLPAV